MLQSAKSWVSNLSLSVHSCVQHDGCEAARRAVSLRQLRPVETRFVVCKSGANLSAAESDICNFNSLAAKLNSFKAVNSTDFK